MLTKITVDGDGPVTIDDLKAHVEAEDFGDDDDKLKIYLASATATVEHDTGFTLRPTQFLIQREDWWGNCLQILAAPVRDISSVKYRDAAGTLQTVDPADYRWRPTEEGAELLFKSGFASPIVQVESFDAVQVAFDAGFDNPTATGAGDDPQLDAKPQIKQAILLLAGHWYQNREAVTEGSKGTMPLGYDALVEQVKIYR